MNALYIVVSKSIALKTIIVDDEKPSREALSTYISDYCSDVEILAACDSVKSAYRAIQLHNPDLVFLDIEMPNGNGFDLLHLFNPVNFRVIFVTAYIEYAIKAFRYSASDYLLKPVKVDELVESVNKIRCELQAGIGGLAVQELLKNLNGGNSHFDKIVIPDMKGFQVVDIPSIICCEADGYCTHFYISQNIKLTSTKNLKYYDNILSGNNFMRVHNSWLINPIHVKSYTHQGDINLSENKVCGLGNNYKKRFLEFWGKLK